MILFSSKSLHLISIMVKPIHRTLSISMGSNPFECSPWIFKSTRDMILWRSSMVKGDRNNFTFRDQDINIIMVSRMKGRINRCKSLRHRYEPLAGVYGIQTIHKIELDEIHNKTHNSYFTLTNFFNKSLSFFDKNKSLC